MKLTRRSDSQLPLILPHISTYNYELYSTGKNEYTLNSYTYHEDYVEFKDEVKATHVTVKYKADGKGYNAKFTIELGRRIGCLKPEVLKSGAG
uniref:Uncharacterized protein n=1 Tax=Glossina pallidipes TaxID=7398 RepID=A0A1B0A1C2_GLOPL